MVTRLLGLVLLASLVSCAAMDRGAVLKREELLRASGFEKQIPKNPRQQEHLERFPQHQTLHMTYGDDQSRYVYADAEICNCIWVGDEAAYRKLERAIQKQRRDHAVAASLVLPPMPDESRRVEHHDFNEWGD